MLWGKNSISEKNATYYIPGQQKHIMKATDLMFFRRTGAGSLRCSANILINLHKLYLILLLFLKGIGLLHKISTLFRLLLFPVDSLFALVHFFACAQDFCIVLYNVGEVFFSGNLKCYLKFLVNFFSFFSFF